MICFDKQSVRYFDCEWNLDFTIQHKITDRSLENGTNDLGRLWSIYCFTVTNCVVKPTLVDRVVVISIWNSFIFFFNLTLSFIERNSCYHQNGRRTSVKENFHLNGQRYQRTITRGKSNLLRWKIRYFSALNACLHYSVYPKDLL